MMKQTLRQHFRTARKALPHEEKEQAAQKIAEHFLENITLSQLTTIAAYYPNSYELDPLPLLKRLHEKGYHTALPVIIEKDAPLSFRNWHPEEPLQEGPFFSIPEPTENAPIVSPTHLLIPCIACDHVGTRLGQGGGFYDRTIEALRKQNASPAIIGIGFNCQLSEEPLPSDPWDEKLDAFITPKGMLDFSNQ